MLPFSLIQTSISTFNSIFKPKINPTTLFLNLLIKMQNSSPQDSEQQNGVQSHQQQEYSKVEEIVASNGSEHHQFYHEFRLDLIDHFLGVPHDVWVEHLFGYFTTNQLLRIRLVSKNLSDLVWYYFVNMKTKYSIRVGTTNTKFEKIVDHFLVHLPKLKKIDFQDFDLISTLSLTGRFICS